MNQRKKMRIVGCHLVVIIVTYQLLMIMKKMEHQGNIEKELDISCIRLQFFKEIIYI